MYYSAAYLQEFFHRTRMALEKLGVSYEFIFVNDGSPDQSLDIALTLRDAYPHVSVVELSRGFGHHKAIMAGLREATGDYVFLIDCDLEEQPELIFDFYAQMMKNESDVVFGIQKERKGKWERTGLWPNLL